MAPQEKEALLTLGVCIVFAVLVFPVQNMLPAFKCEVVSTALVIFIAILWVGRTLFGIRLKKLDERDMHIRCLSGIIAAHVFGMIIMAGTIILWMLNRSSMTVPAVQMLNLAFFGWLCLYLSLSVTVLVLYRKGV